MIPSPEPERDRKYGKHRARYIIYDEIGYGKVEEAYEEGYTIYWNEPKKEMLYSECASLRN